VVERGPGRLLALVARASERPVVTLTAQPVRRPPSFDYGLQMPLTAEQRGQYQRDGFIQIRALIDAETLQRIDARFRALVTSRLPMPENLVVMKDVAYVKGDNEPESAFHAVNKILSFENDPVLWPFATDSRLLQIARDLVGPQLNSLSTNLFNKPPGVDSRHPLHQDLRYFALRPADGIVGTWTAIGRCTRENGCLAVIPGSHRGELAEHDKPDWDQVNFGFFAAQDVDIATRVHIEMEPGDTLFFHPLLIHGSGRNRSADFRRAISIHYASIECRRPESLTGSRSATRRISAAIKRIP
jgi:phytanoyl-CoA hydroxylase